MRLRTLLVYPGLPKAQGLGLSVLKARGSFKARGGISSIWVVVSCGGVAVHGR
jgi:hypothetical protein